MNSIEDRGQDCSLDDIIALLIRLRSLSSLSRLARQGRPYQAFVSTIFNVAQRRMNVYPLHMHNFLLFNFLPSLILKAYFHGTICIRTVNPFLPGWSGAEIKCTVHVALPKWPINQFNLVQQSRQHALRAYFSTIYILSIQARVWLLSITTELSWKTIMFRHFSGRIPIQSILIKKLNLLKSHFKSQSRNFQVFQKCF